MVDVFVDAETCPTQNEEMKALVLADVHAEHIAELAAVRPPSNYKDPEKKRLYMDEANAKIEAEYEQKKESAVLRTSLDGWLGQVCVIGYAIEDSEPQAFTVADLSPGAELLALKSFFSLLTGLHHDSDPVRLIGHNILDFDLRFLWRRSIVHGVRPPGWLQRDPARWSESFFDTMIAGAKSREYISLDKLCAILGIPSTCSVRGAEVASLVSTGRIADVVEHCLDDVRRTREVYRRMSFAPAVEASAQRIAG